MQNDDGSQNVKTLLPEELSALRLLGRGNTAEIFLFEGHALKLFSNRFPENGVMKEWHVTRAVQAVYDHMPKALGLVRCGERHGILYELAEGQDLLFLIRKAPLRLLTAGKMLAELHVEIHKKEIGGILSVREKLRQEIGRAGELMEKEKQEITDRLLRLPVRGRLCHFDFHPGNIMISGGHVSVLDWLTACSGDPAADIARTCLLLKYGELRNGDRVSGLILRVVKACVRRSYMRNVLRLSDVTRNEVRQWTVPVAAARLSEWLTEHEKARLLRLIRDALQA